MVVAALALGSGAGSASADPKRVFMAPDDHTDYFWSATASEYEALFVEMLDYYLDQADATSAEPPEFQSRFSADGSLWLREYQRQKSPAEFQRLVDRVKSGAWQRQVATEIETYANSLMAEASSALGTLIQRSGTNQRFFAFNPLSWTRTDIADTPYTGALPVHVVDLATGSEVRSQVVTIGGQQFVRAEAPNIPSVGYKVFEIRAGAGQAFAGAPTASATTGVMENDAYRLTLSPRGAITSFVDKRLANRELAGSTGGFALNDLGAGTGSLTLENAGPVSVTLRATSASPLAHTTRVTLFRGRTGWRSRTRSPKTSAGRRSGASASTSPTRTFATRRPARSSGLA